MNPEHVVRRISDLRKLSLETARAGLFKIRDDKSQRLLPAEYIILQIAEKRLTPYRDTTASGKFPGIST
jgi:hypothetical protein